MADLGTAALTPQPDNPAVVDGYEVVGSTVADTFVPRRFLNVGGDPVAIG